jgi:ribosomal protein L24E
LAGGGGGGGNAFRCSSSGQSEIHAVFVIAPGGHRADKHVYRSSKIPFPVRSSDPPPTGYTAFPAANRHDLTNIGRKIYPGKGKIFVRADSKVFRFFNGKSESLFLQRKNPRRIAWTVLYRRQHKKGISEVCARYTQLFKFGG